MNKIILLILILASNLFAQGWNNTVTTNITIPNNIDIFTNSSGIHILLQTTENEIIYYNLNSAGEEDEDKTESLETIGYFPSIVGTNDIIYAIYKTVDNNNNDVIRAQYSTDNGSSWIWNSNLDIATSEYFCNGVDAIYEETRGVHAVWGIKDSYPNHDNFETYYARLTYTTPYQWTENKNVTDDNSAQYGGNPQVTVSPNRVHVSFNTDATTNNTGVGDVKTRDRYNGSWEDPQTVVSSNLDEQSIDERLLVRGDFLYLFFIDDISGLNELKSKRRRADNTEDWEGGVGAIESRISEYEDAFEVKKTDNGDIHIVCKKHIPPPGHGWTYIYKYYNSSGWHSDNNFDDYTSENLVQIGLSSVSNDLFVTWKIQENTNLKFRQYDALPLAPQNLSVTKSANNHPILRWSANIEPDINNYQVWKKGGDEGGDWHIKATTTNTTYEDPDEIVLTGPKQANESLAYYKLKAVDLGSNPSDFSNEVNIRVGIEPPSKISVGNYSGESYSYQLYQNFPNPFNPTTQISYSIKSAGTVTLKVYDMLGKEVATLVNESKDPGNYSVTFNAADLPSGIYVYKLTVNNFTTSRKLMLVK